MTDSSTKLKYRERRLRSKPTNCHCCGNKAPAKPEPTTDKPNKQGVGYVEQDVDYVKAHWTGVGPELGFQPKAAENQRVVLLGVAADVGFTVGIAAHFFFQQPYFPQAAGLAEQAILADVAVVIPDKTCPHRR